MAGPYRTPRVDIFTTLLTIALVAVIVATLFAYLETSDYKDNKYKGAPNVPTLVYADRSDLAPSQIAFDELRPARQSIITTWSF